MKTLCVAVFVLSLISVCQAASLTCQNLTKPLDKDPDISGTWHDIAFSSGNCLNSTKNNGSFQPSVRRDITAQSTPNIYDTNVKVKMSGKCVNKSDSFLFANHSLIAMDRNNVSAGVQAVLLQTGCPDCLVERGTEGISTLTLLSRRKSIDPAELKEFEAQAECLGMPKPQIMSTDHDYESCPSFGHGDFKIMEAAFNILFCIED